VTSHHTSEEGPAPPGDNIRRDASFTTTHWSRVVAAGSQSADAQRALAELCQLYWYPVYAYVRRRGRSIDDAQDLTQEFFARLLARNWVGNADRQKGRFRSFLLGAVNHFLADEWDKAKSQKRGGGIPDLPLVMEDAEKRFSLEPADPETPERQFERRWAMTLLDKALHQLRDEYGSEGRSELFSRLNPCLVGERTSEHYAAMATQLGVSESTVKSYVHRMRQRFRQMIRHEIAQTVADPTDIEDELRHMFVVLGG
jgi:RNA polymerase sigma factor (sigma-70 family)